MIKSGDHDHRYEKNPKKLPCISFCALDGFKVDGFYFYNDQSYFNATYSMEDIFDDATVVRLRNASLFRTVETKTLLMGRCFTVCDLDNKGKRNYTWLTLNSSLDLKVFVHLPEEEMWLNMESEFPTNVPDLVLNSSETQLRGIRLRLIEVETTVLNKPNDRCKVYSDRTEDSAALFTRCCKDAITSNLYMSVNCSIPAMAPFVPKNSTTKSCKNDAEAQDAIVSFKNIFLHVEDQSGKTGLKVSW